MNEDRLDTSLHEWTKQGLIPAYRMGGRVYYNYAEVIDSAKRIRKYDRDKALPV